LTAGYKIWYYMQYKMPLTDKLDRKMEY